MTRYSLGFASSNTLAMAVMKSVLLYYIARRGRIRFRNLMEMAIFLVITYYFTGSRLFALIGCIFLTLAAYAMINPNAYTSKRVLVAGEAILPVIMFFIGLTLILFKDVFALLLGEKYREAAYILPFLIFNPIMYTISETTVNKKSRESISLTLEHFKP